MAAGMAVVGLGPLECGVLHEVRALRPGWWVGERVVGWVGYRAAFDGTARSPCSTSEGDKGRRGCGEREVPPLGSGRRRESGRRIARRPGVISPGVCTIPVVRRVATRQ